MSSLKRPRQSSPYSGHKQKLLERRCSRRRPAVLEAVGTASFENRLGKSIQRDRLRPLNWKSKCTAPHILCHDTQGPRDGEHHGVEIWLSQAIETHDLAAMRIHIGVR